MYRLSEVAELMNCSLSHVYALVQSGVLPSVNIGLRKALRVAEEDLEAFIASRREHRHKAAAQFPPRTNPRRAMKQWF